MATKDDVEVLVYKIDNEGLSYAVTDYGDLFKAAGLASEWEAALRAMGALSAALVALAEDHDIEVTWA